MSVFIMWLLAVTLDPCLIVWGINAFMPSVVLDWHTFAGALMLRLALK